MGSDLTLALGMSITAILAALGGLIVLFVLQSSFVQSRKSIFDKDHPETRFLFDGESLIDCTAAGRAILNGTPLGGTAWEKLKSFLGQIFPDADAALKGLTEQGIVTLDGKDASGLPLLLRAELRGGVTHLSISDGTEDRLHPSDPMIHRSTMHELHLLRAAVMQAPIMVWRERENGDVIWANTPYLIAAAETVPKGRDLSWPLPRLFSGVAVAHAVEGQRQSIVDASGKTRWFDLHSVTESGERRVYAIPCDAAVSAETSLRDFMQTLAKTFAHLPVGLAIFDNQKRLQLFNPALLDLTGLQPDFLSSRPTVGAMLDAMRDVNMVPEPKDYRQWRQGLEDLERTVDGGVYEEIWNLPGGQTYKVVGRPQRNGALALMFEDISNEISRNRRYREDLDLGQSAIDAIEEAIAVFSATGQLVMSNEAYACLWDDDTADRLSELGIRSAAELWAERSAPSPLWSEIRDYVGTIGDREPWSGEARLLDGRSIACRMRPLKGGATLISFRVITEIAELPAAATALLRSHS